MGCQCQIKWEKFGLTHHTAAHFGTSQWQEKCKVNVPFLLYRIGAFLYFWGFWIYQLVDTKQSGMLPYYLIYLTNWTYLTTMFDIAVQMVSALVGAYRCRHGVKPLVPTWLYQMHWMAINISHTSEPFVTILYWTAVFPQIDMATSYSDIHLHLITTLYTLADLMIHSSPRRAHHVIYPLIYAMAYLVFTVIYYVCGGLDPKGNTGIYPILDWAKPGLTAGVAAGSVVAFLLLHAATWGLVKWRLHLHGRWLGRRVTATVDVDVGSGGGSGGGSSGGRAGGKDGGERSEVCVEIDVGDGGSSALGIYPNLPPGDGRPADSGKAFDNVALDDDEDGVPRIA